MTISEILGILKELQFPIEHHQNPLGSVYTTVTRLMREGEVVAGEPKNEKKTYRWARINLKIPPDKLSEILPAKQMVEADAAPVLKAKREQKTRKPAGTKL